MSRGLLSLLLLSVSPHAGAAPPSAEVAAHLAAGDCARAVAALPNPTEDAARLAIARCQTGMGSPRRALEILDPALDGPLRGYAALLAGEAGLELGRPAEAAVVLKLAQEQLSGESAARAQMLRGRALVESGDALSAREVLRPLLSGARGEAGHIPSPLGADPAEVRWWLAEGARLRGDTAAAVPVWQTLWTHNPTSPFAVQAANRLAAHATEPPSASTAEGRALISARIATLQKLNLHEEALRLSELLPVDGSAAGIRRRARMAFRGRNYALAVELFARITDPTPSERFDHALSASRIGDYDRAEALYMALMAAAPESAEADFGSFKIGYLAYDAHKLPEAVVLLRQHLRRYPRGGHADEARWFIGWSLYSLSDLPAADAAFAELLELHPQSSLAPGARYWRARIAERQGQTDAARAGLEAVLTGWPTSGYAWLAAGRLGRTYPEKPLVAAPSPPASLRVAAWDRGTALAAVGLDAWAREQLGPLVATARGSGSEGRLAMAHALIAAGDYVTAQSLARDACGSPWREGGNAQALQACYPRPQGLLADRLTAEVGLDRNLPYAIMTAESALRPEVSSPAGARGLMQLMPALGAELHAARGYQRPYDADDLYQPGYNAALGITELGRLQRRFPELPMAIAGYNGGAEAVARWLGQQGGSPEPDAFAENIGYTETRTYVRRVLGYLQTYRYVYGDR